jgi:UDP-N-acetyl-D-mannosaminuronate dehydrogenase
VNIALANEYARYADTHGLNVYTAISAANTQPYSHIHTPGVGVGGHCIPVYPYFLFANPYDESTNVQAYSETSTQTDEQLNTTAKQLFSTKVPGDTLVLPRQARRINDAMAEYAVQRIEDVVGPLQQKSVLLLGVAYRGNVRETAFTSARLLQDALLRHGAIVYSDDPLYSKSELRAMGYEPLPEDDDSKIEAILLQCAHRVYQSLDFARFVKCKVVLDGRHTLDRIKIEAPGIIYIAIGEGNCQQAEQNIAECMSSMAIQ